MPKIIWFEGYDHFDPSFVVAEQITDATVMHCYKDGEEDGAELSIGLVGTGSRWKSYNFPNHDSADDALSAIADILLDKREGEYLISKTDGSWLFMEEKQCK